MTGLQRPRAEMAHAVPSMLVRALPVVLAAAGFAFVPWPYALVAVVAAALGAAAPATLGVWIAITVLALAGLTHPTDSGEWRPALSLAIVHLMHLLGVLGMALPLRGRVRVGVLKRPVMRWVALQIPAQLLLGAALWAQGVLGGAHLPVAAVWAGCALLAAVILLFLLLRRR